MSRLLFCVIATWCCAAALARAGGGVRHEVDSTGTRKDTLTLRGVDVTDRRDLGSAILQMDDITADAIYAGRKSELIRLEQLTINTATNNARQAYASIPGLNIWESDGAGLQLGIGGRGLSPDRTSNFTTRQNGYDISADPLGYPESYYTPPLDALDRIEVVRGGGALRYGTQFGGVVNFVFREPTRTSPLAGRVALTGGSFLFASAMADVHGSTEDVWYRVFYQGKRSDGWRPNAEFDMHTVYAMAGVGLSDRLRVRAEYTGMTYLAHQPGGLTDRQFETDPSASYRARNWFTVSWNLASLRFDYLAGETTTIRSLFFGNVSGRTSLGNLDRITMADLGGPRTMIDGSFTNLGNETTVSFDVDLLGNISSIVAGFRLFHGNTVQQQGDASDSSDADFTFTNPDRLEGSDYTFPNDNVAVFTEGLIRLSDHVSLVPGVRVEHITTRAEGYYRVTVRDLAGNPVVDTAIAEDRTRSRTLVLGGLSASWKPVQDLEVYANAVQNYRSITFSDLRIANPNLVVDPEIGDERGYTLDFGLRGSVAPWLSVDVSAFYLRYQDRIGEIFRTGEAPLFLPYRYRTNIADAFTAGVEAVADLSISQMLEWGQGAPVLHVMLNASAIDGRYLASENTSVSGNRVEFVPPYTIRAGIRTRWSGLSASLLASWVGRHYSDASNTEFASSAVVGPIPAYHVVDFSVAYTISSFTISATANNVLNSSYFTRRATSYPGPGIIPAEPRSLFLSIAWDGDIITSNR